MRIGCTELSMSVAVGEKETAFKCEENLENKKNYYSLGEEFQNEYYQKL